MSKLVSRRAAVASTREPPPADYSDEVTEEQLARLKEIEDRLKQSGCTWKQVGETGW